MDKGYYEEPILEAGTVINISELKNYGICFTNVAIHNKNGQGLLRKFQSELKSFTVSQSTIKMDKGYYRRRGLGRVRELKRRNPQ